RFGEQALLAPPRLPDDRAGGDQEGHQSVPEPDLQPPPGRRLPRSDPGRDDRSHADRHLTEPRDGGEEGRPLHGLADEPQVVHRPQVEGGRRHEPGSGGLRIGHGLNLRPTPRNRQGLFGIKSDRPYAPWPSICFFAIAATMPTIDISPMDLPMESSEPKTR